MFDYLKTKDTELFLYLNSHHSTFWDSIMWAFSGKLTWIPLYLIVLIYIIYKYKKKSILIILSFLVLVLLTDQACTILKYGVKRYRPTHNLLIQHTVHTLKGYLGGQYSFVSAHAANSFGFATLTGCLLRPHFRNLIWILYIWAAAVSYSRIYLGVHYPSDIICGGILGISLAMLIFLGYKKLTKGSNLPKYKTN